MDYRVIYSEIYPSSGPCRERSEEFSKETEPEAIQEFRRLAEKADSDNRDGRSKGFWEAKGLYRIDQREITTKIPVELPAYRF